MLVVLCIIDSVVVLKHFISSIRCTTTWWTRPATRVKTSSRSICRAAKSSRKSYSIERSRALTPSRWRRATEHHPPDPTATSSQIQVNILSRPFCSPNSAPMSHKLLRQIASSLEGVLNGTHDKLP